MIVLLVIIVLLFLLGQIPLVVGGAYDREETSLWVKIGVISIPLSQKKKSNKPKKEKKKAPKKKSMTVPQILSLALDLLPVLQTAVGRFYHKLKMNELILLVVLPGEDDPARGAILYGQISGALAALWAPLVEVLHIQEGRAGISVDFTAPELALEVRGELAIKLGQIIIITGAFAIHGLGIFLHHRRQNKLREAVS